MRNIKLIIEFRILSFSLYVVGNMNMCIVVYMKIVLINVT